MPGRHKINGQFVTDHVVTEQDTHNDSVMSAAKVLYPSQKERIALYVEAIGGEDQDE